MKRYIQLFLLAIVCLLLAGCTGGTNSFTWFVDAIPTNLDPQIASTSEDIIACTNLHGTLLREDENGTLQLDLAESYTVSDDGKTYTFTLKEGLVYYSRSSINTDYTLTADDFVFAFERIFTAKTASPYSDLYANIQNGTAILDGECALKLLGVKALDERTVQFTLETADPAFLETLALPAAAPCNEAFFESTKGTYGLTSSTTLTSGAFYLYNWTSTGLFLRRNGDGVLVDNLRLVENSDSTGMSAEELIFAEKCTAATDTSADATTLSSITYSDTTWCLLYNQNTVLANQDLRTALSTIASSISFEASGTFIPDVQGVIPDDIDVEGVDYRQENGSALPTTTSATEAFAAVLSTLSMSDLKDITLMIPADNGLDAYVDSINQAWQKELSLYFSVEVVDIDTFNSRLASGDYTIALAPITVTQSDLISFMGSITTSYGLGYSDASYNTLLQLASASNGTQKRALIYQAECLLLEQIVVTPLFVQQKRLLVDATVEGLVFDPFGPVLDLTYTTKS